MAHIGHVRIGIGSQSWPGKCITSAVQGADFVGSLVSCLWNNPCPHPQGGFLVRQFALSPLLLLPQRPTPTHHTSSCTSASKCRTVLRHMNLVQQIIWPSPQHLRVPHARVTLNVVNVYVCRVETSLACRAWHPLTIREIQQCILHCKNIRFATCSSPWNHMTLSTTAVLL